MLNPSRQIRIGLVVILLASLALGLSTNVIGLWGLIVAFVVAIYLALVVLVLPQRGTTRSAA